MQILDVKVHTEPKSTPQALKFGEDAGERYSRFDQALGSEQERRSIDDREHKPAATIADNSKKQSSVHSIAEMSADQGTIKLLGSDDDDVAPKNDWHDFLERVSQHQNNETSAMTTGELAVINGAKEKAPLSQSEAKEVSALLEQLGISLTAQEKKSIVDTGELSDSLVTKMNQLLASAVPSAQQVEQAPTMTSGHMVVATSGEENKTPLTKEQAKEMSTLLDLLGIALTAQEKQNLLDKGELSDSLVTKMNQLLASAVPSAQQVEQAPTMTSGHMVVATSGEENKTPLTKEQAKEMSTLLDLLGISLTAQEKQNLLDKGELSDPLVTRMNQLLASVVPSAQQVEPEQRLAALLPGLASVTMPEDSVVEPFIEQLSAADQEELTIALYALAEGKPAELKNWLARQNLPNELIQPLISLVNAAENALASLTATEIHNGVQDNMKASLAEVLAAVVTLVKTEKGTGRELAIIQEGNNKLLQTLQQLTQRVSPSEGVPSSTLLAQQLTQPKENKVLLAFSNTAQELRALIQESLRDDNQPRSDSRELQFMRGFEQQLNGLSQTEGPKNTNPNFMATSLQAQLQQPTVAQQGARAMTAPSQLAETAFEQARQNQQYIDITGPQGPAQLKEQVAVMFNNRNQVAEMRLDPPDLGRLNIRLQMTGEQQASVTFLVNTPQAREAIEQAMPRLREMLEDQGIQLTDSNVRDESSQLARESQQQGNGGKGGKNLTGDKEGQLDEGPTYVTKVDVPKGQIDYYV